MNRDDGEGFRPHPGDPWHPSWSGGGDDEDDLDEAPQPREGEDRAGFLKRLLGRHPEGEHDEEDADSAAHVYDAIRDTDAVEEDQEEAVDEPGEDTEEFALPVAAEVAPGAGPIGDDATEELAPIEPPSEAPAPEVLADVSFDAHSAGAAGAQWAMDDVPDGHISDAAARLEADLAIDAAADERDSLDAELRYAASTAAEAEVDHAADSASADAASAAAAEAAAAAAALGREVAAAREGGEDVESEVAGEVAKSAERAAMAVELAAAAHAAEDEGLHVAADVVRAASEEAGETGQRIEEGVAEEHRAKESTLLGDEIVRLRSEATEAEIDHSGDLARALQHSLEAAEAVDERDMAEAELAAAAAGVAAEREHEAYLLGTDDAATSLVAPEVEMDGFQFDAPESEIEEPAGGEGVGIGAAAAAGVVGAVAGADLVDEGDASSGAQDVAPKRRGWRRLFGARRAAVVAAAVTSDSDEHGVASEIMADTRAPDDDGTEDLDLGGDAEEAVSDEPHLVPAGPDAGFEGWLDGGGNETDSLDEPSADDAEGEIAAWMAFTGGVAPAASEDEPSDLTEEITAEVGDERLTDELPVVVAATTSGGGGTDDQEDGEDEEDDTTEFLLGEGEEEEVEEAAPEPAVDADASGDQRAEAEEEVEAIGTVHELSAFQEEELPPGDEIVELGFDAFEDFSEADYLSQDSTTRDHAGLAAAMAMAEEEETEQVALSAAIPGIETGVVGFEDVVEAEGQFAGSASSPRASDLALRVGSAILLIVVFLASLLWRPALTGLAIVVFVIAAGEFYTVLMQKGHRPLALFGFLALVGASVGTVAWGVIAIPMAFALTSLLILLFFAVAPGRVRPLVSYSITIAVAAWVGLGAFAFPIIESEDYRTLVVAVVAAVAIMDISSYFVGRTLGRNQLAPVVSPKKTWEGLVGGVVVVLLIGALLHYFPPFELTSGLLLGAVIAIVAPLGDLAVSVAKRSLGVKDMGAILPGHGGLVDRIDSLLFVIPAAWALYAWLDLL